jgi:chitinase
LAHKLKFITDYGIGGMMFWELSGDYHYDNQKGYYTAGHDMTQFAYDFFNSVDIMEAPERILPDEYANFSHSFTGTYSHPNFSPEFTITNNTGSTIPGSWNLEFDLPKSARWESTWGTGTLSTIDESHPFLTRYRIVGPSWQSIPDGESATITGAIKLCFTNGPLNVVLNGKQSEDVFSNISSVEKSEDVSVYPNPTNGIVNISSNKTIRKITILSIDGQKIEEICNPKESMNLSHLDKGIYLLKIESSEKDEILKLIRY